MRWFKRGRWKTGIAIVGMLLLFVLMIWLPVSAAGVHEMTSGLAGPVSITVQATPTQDATVTALNKEKLAQEVQQLKNQNESDLFGWLRTNAAILLSTSVVVIGGLIGLGRWLGDRRSEREKRAEERFQSIVTGLGSKDVEVGVGAAIMLRTFLSPTYKQFHRQTFDLAVAYLRLRGTGAASSTHPSSSSQTLISISNKSLTQEKQSDLNTPLPLDAWSQMLMTVFKESFPLARTSIQQRPLPPSSFFIFRGVVRRGVEEPLYRRLQALDAADIRLDNAYLAGADLAGVRLLRASLWKAILTWANLREAFLREANLTGAYLREVNLTGAYLREVNLTGANLTGANLREANLTGANLTGANLTGANLTRANLEAATSLEGTKMNGVIGLSLEQQKACVDKGAIFDSSEPPVLGPAHF